MLSRLRIGLHRACSAADLTSTCPTWCCASMLLIASQLTRAIERLMADGRYELIYCSRCATYGMALLTMLDTELSTPLLVYEVTPKYHVAPLVRLFNT